MSRFYTKIIGEAGEKNPHFNISAVLFQNKFAS